MITRLIHSALPTFPQHFFASTQIERYFTPLEYDLICLVRDFDFRSTTCLILCKRQGSSGRKPLVWVPSFPVNCRLKLTALPAGKLGAPSTPPAARDYARLIHISLDPSTGVPFQQLEQNNLTNLALEDFSAILPVKFQKARKCIIPAIWRMVGNRDFSPQQGSCSQPTPFSPGFGNTRYSRRICHCAEKSL